jgi:hypothetical protein
MKPNSVVIVSLHSPKEKIWGVLEEITPAGVSLQGLDLNAFDDWLNLVGTDEEMGLATVFYPMCRVERIAMDEAVSNIPSLSTTFQQRTRLALQEYLSRFPH